MIKAKDFLNYVCNNLDYRSFTGYPQKEFISLYNNMDSSFMHYIPTVRNDIAFSLALGTSLCGVKSIVIANGSKFLEDYEKLKNTVFSHKVPFLILLFNDCNIKKLPMKTFKLGDAFESNLKRASSFALSNKTQVIILIDGVF